MYPVQSETATIVCDSRVVGEHKAGWIVTGQMADAETTDGWVKMYTYKCGGCNKTDMDYIGRQGSDGNKTYHRYTPNFNEIHAGYTEYSYRDSAGNLQYAGTPTVEITSYYYTDYAGVKTPTTQTSGSVNGGSYCYISDVNSVQNSKLIAKGVSDIDNLTADAGGWIYVGTPA